jgi:pilus assembly protein TadC
MEFMKDLERMLYRAGVDMQARGFAMLTLVYAVGFGLGAALVFMQVSLSLSMFAFAAIFIVTIFSIYALLLLTSNSRVALAEDALPDLLSLMSSNIRSGLTPDRALSLSARREFGPLTKEVNRATKLVVGGRSFDDAFETVGMNLGSSIITKAVRLIVEGSRAGGNLSELLDNTSSDIRRFNALRNEVSSSVMLYRFFLFTAAALGAPFLFATANFVISLVHGLQSMARIDGIQTSLGGQVFPILEKMSTNSVLSPDVVFYFSLGAMFLSTLFAALAGGVISTGRASDDLKYFPILLIVALVVFMGTKFVLGQLFATMFFVVPS